jgi:hypothetical protein
MIQLIGQIFNLALRQSRRAANLAPQRKGWSPECWGQAYRQSRFPPGPLLVCLAVASSMLWEGGCRASKTVEPSDQNLISAFRGHRQAFEKLQEMAAQDARRNWYLWASDPSKLDQSRRDGYKNLISEIRPDLQVAMNGTTGVVRFLFAGEGVAIGPGWVKGIEYVPSDYSREGVLLPDLDKAASLPAHVYMREIEPRWLIFYQRDE